MGKDYQDHGLYLHNWYRKRHGAPKMVLTDELNQIADAYAHQLACRRTLVHSNSGGRYGENLYMSMGDTSKTKKQHVYAACEAWYKEKRYYSYNRPGFSMQTGHFTAVVWKSSTKLGIGYGESNGYVVVVANYQVHGNMQMNFGKNVLPYREVEDTDDEEEEKKEQAKKLAAEEAQKQKEAQKKAEEGKQVESKDDEDELKFVDGIKSQFDELCDNDKTIGWEEVEIFLNKNKSPESNTAFDKLICVLLIKWVTIRTGEKKRINFDEFGNLMKSVFTMCESAEKYDKDKSDSLDPFELKEALDNAGFTVGYKTMQTIKEVFCDGGDFMGERGYLLCYTLLSILQVIRGMSQSFDMFEDFSLKTWLQEQMEKAMN